MLEFAALGRVDQDGFGIDAFAELSDEIGLADELVEQSRLRCGQGQPVDRMVDEREHTETVHDVDDVDEEFVRDRVLREFEEHVDDGFGIMTAGACVPQSQRSDLVGVDVLRGPRQLRKRGDRHGRLDGEGMSRFQQHSPIGLHDQRTIHSILPFPKCDDTRGHNTSITPIVPAPSYLTGAQIRGARLLGRRQVAIRGRG